MILKLGNVQNITINKLNKVFCMANLIIQANISGFFLKFLYLTSPSLQGMTNFDLYSKYYGLMIWGIVVWDKKKFNDFF